jgi:hypothetical protein
LTDDLSDLLQDTNEIQEALGRSYNVGEVDEGELEDGRILIINFM